MKQYSLYINGEWTKGTSDALSDVINPATEEVIAQVPKATEEDVNLAVKAAKEAFPLWNQRPVAERIAYVRKIREGIEKYQKEFVDTIVAELGSAKTYVENGQLPLTLREVKAAIEEAEAFHWTEQIDNAEVIYEGMGVVACITPWNYPLNQIQRKVSPALIAGNTMVVKPASMTPLSALLLAKVIDEAGIPKGVFNVITGSGGTVGNTLVEHPDVAVISFTGSTEVGRDLYVSARQQIKKLVLELGGKSPLIYLEDGDLRLAVQKAMDSILDNQGQTCAALTRLIVPESELEAVEQEILRYYNEVVVIGDPTQSDTKVGPMISEKQRQTVLNYIASGKAEGAKILIGGHTISGTGFYIEPTVFTHVTNEMKIAREEIFGPVLSVITYKTVEEAVQIANDSDYGLSGAVVGPEEQAKAVAKQLQTGNVYVNNGARTAKAPFGGYKQSGLGRENGRFGIEDYLEVKALFL